MEITLNIGTLFIIISITILIRNYIVGKASSKAFDLIYKQINYEELNKEYLVVDNYFKRVYDIRKWTFNQLFPGLKEK